MAVVLDYEVIFTKPVTFAEGAAVQFGDAIVSDGTVNFNGVLSAANVVLGTGAVPVVAAGPGAGSGATVASFVGTDVAGTFLLAAGAAPAGGTLATVVFGGTYPTAPLSVIATAANTNGSGTNITVGALGQTRAGFTIQGSQPAAGSIYQVNYFCL